MRNLLLAGATPDELKRLAFRLARTDLFAGQCLQAEGQRIDRVYFPESGLLSLMGGAGERRVETGMVGREGMSGAGALLGASVSSHKVVVRVSGRGLALPVAELRKLRLDCPALHERLLAFVGVWAVQMEQTICTTGRYSVEQRLARWLLMAHDRLTDDEIGITHDCLATVLGVRRPGVTVALHLIEGELAIRSRRGRITIRDRERLRSLAGDAYCEARPDVGVRPAPDVRKDGALFDLGPALAP